jgi:hypothetical protein
VKNNSPVICCPGPVSDAEPSSAGRRGFLSLGAKMLAENDP